jgi:hypothetical protein
MIVLIFFGWSFFCRTSRSNPDLRIHFLTTPETVCSLSICHSDDAFPNICRTLDLNPHLQLRDLHP